MGPIKSDAKKQQILLTVTPWSCAPCIIIWISTYLNECYLHSGSEWVDDDDEPVEGDDGQSQRGDVDGNTFTEHTS